jgi:hypothetical protein
MNRLELGVGDRDLIDSREVIPSLEAHEVDEFRLGGTNLGVVRTRGRSANPVLLGSHQSRRRVREGTRWSAHN